MFEYLGYLINKNISDILFIHLLIGIILLIFIIYSLYKYGELDKHMALVTFLYAFSSHIIKFINVIYIKKYKNQTKKLI